MMLCLSVSVKALLIVTVTEELRANRGATRGKVGGLQQSNEADAKKKST